MTEFETLYRKYSKDIYRFSIYLCGNTGEAEDIVSETFMRAWNAPGAIRQETVKAYLLAIARNCYLDKMRHRTRRGEVELDDTHRDARPSPHFRSESRDELAEVMTLLQEFSESDRTALLLRAVEGLSYEEIAATMGIPVTTAKVKVHRVRMKLTKLRSNPEKTL